MGILIFLGIVLVVSIGYHIITRTQSLDAIRQGTGGAKGLEIFDVDMMDGIEFEGFVASLLRQNGYSRVEVTKASGDYGVDITAKKDNVKYAFQCKCYSTNLGVKPVQEVYSGARMYQAQACVVVTNAYFTANAITMAQRLGVTLWDRDKLERMMKGSSTRLFGDLRTSDF